MRIGLPRPVGPVCHSHVASFVPATCMPTLARVRELYTLYQPLFRISHPHSHPNDPPAPQATEDTRVAGYVTPAPLQPRMSPGALKISWGRLNHPSLPPLRPCLSPLIARVLRPVKYTLAGLICQGGQAHVTPPVSTAKPLFYTLSPSLAACQWHDS